MSKNHGQSLRGLLVCAYAVVLVACSGGGDVAEPPQAALVSTTSTSNIQSTLQGNSALAGNTPTNGTSPSGPSDLGTPEPAPSAKKIFAHPGIAFNLDDLAYFKANIDQEPWKTVYSRFLGDPKAKLTYKAHAVEFLEGDAATNVYEADMDALYIQTIIGYISGNSAYSENATAIFDAWCTTHKSGLPFLKVGDHISLTLGSADLLRATYSGWTPAHTKRCQDYVEKVYWGDGNLYIGGSTRGAGTQLRSANQGANQLNTQMSIAVFVDDREKFDMVINAFRTDPSGGIRNSLANGEVGDTGRDQGHAYAQITHWAEAAETAWKQGVDLFAVDDNRLLKVMEYWSQYNLGESPDFIKFGPSYDLYANFGADGRGVSAGADALNIIHKAYAVRKGLAAPYTDRYRAIAVNDKKQIIYYRNSDVSIATPLNLAAWQQPPTTPLVKNDDLISEDVGNVGAIGSTNYSAGVWTLTTSSQDREVGYRFAYKAFKGDGTFVARISSLSGQGQANAGLMIRTQLDARAATPYIWLHLGEGAKGAQVFWRKFIGILNGSLQNFPNATVPYWVKLVRRGNFIYGYSSPDGLNWANTSNERLHELTDTLYVGLAATSGDASSEATAIFDNVGFGTADGSLAEAPKSIVISSGQGLIQLDWALNPKAAFYTIGRATSAGEPYEIIASTVNDSKYIDTSTIPSVLYFYTVSSASYGGLSSNSFEISGASRLP